MKIRLPDRSSLDKLLALAGVVVILIQMIAIAYSPLHVIVVSAGILMVYVGVWRVATHLLPDRRRYTRLRGEVDEFIRQVRQLNAEKARGNTSSAEQTRRAIYEATERIVSVAGVPDPTD